MLSKVLERAVHTQLIDYLEKGNLLCSKQYGYRKSHSTELAVTLFVDAIRKEVDNGKLVGSVFIDLSKAFDTIGHSNLLSKLPSYGINSTELDWLTSYLFSRYQYVQINDKISEKMPIFCGVPQGSILGPLLFLIFFNDFYEKLMVSKVVKFADDTVIYYASSNFHDIEKKLNEDIEAIKSYFDENDLIINLNKGKTECMLFGTAKRIANSPRNLNLFYGTINIVVTESYKYLGILLDPGLTFNHHFNKVYKKAAARINLLKKLRPILSIAAAEVVVKSVILPTVTYCGIINLSITNTQRQRYNSLESRATKIVYDNEENSLPKIENIKRRAWTLARQCLDGNVCYDFQKYFILTNHEYRTRNNSFMINIQKTKLKYAQNSYYYMGAKVYNALPLVVRKEKSFPKFKSLLDEFFK